MSERDKPRQTRESEARELKWVPPTALETPTPPEGFSYRWVRHELVGEDQSGNVYNRLRQHYEPVTADELAGFDVESMEDGKHAGVVRSGDLILMKAPTTITEQRKEHYAKQNKLMEQAIDQEMAARTPKSMPFSNESDPAKVSFGKRSPTIED